MQINAVEPVRSNIINYGLFSVEINKAPNFMKENSRPIQHVFLVQTLRVESSIGKSGCKLPFMSVFTMMRATIFVVSLLSLVSVTEIAVRRLPLIMVTKNERFTEHGRIMLRN